MKDLSRDVQRYAQAHNYEYVISKVIDSRRENVGEKYGRGSYVVMRSLLLRKNFKEAEAFDPTLESLDKFAKKLEKKGLIAFVEH